MLGISLKAAEAIYTRARLETFQGFSILQSYYYRCDRPPDPKSRLKVLNLFGIQRVTDYIGGKFDVPSITVTFDLFYYRNRNMSPANKHHMDLVYHDLDIIRKKINTGSTGIRPVITRPPHAECGLYYRWRIDMPVVDTAWSPFLSSQSSLRNINNGPDLTNMLMFAIYLSGVQDTRIPRRKVKDAVSPARVGGVHEAEGPSRVDRREWPQYPV